MSFSNSASFSFLKYTPMTPSSKNSNASPNGASSCSKSSCCLEFRLSIPDKMDLNSGIPYLPTQILKSDLLERNLNSELVWISIIARSRQHFLSTTRRRGRCCCIKWISVQSFDKPLTCLAEIMFYACGWNRCRFHGWGAKTRIVQSLGIGDEIVLHQSYPNFPCRSVMLGDRQALQLFRKIGLLCSVRQHQTRNLENVRSMER